MIETLLSQSELEAVRRKFPRALRRRETIKLLSVLNVRVRKARTLIEGDDAPLQPLAGRTPKEWSRERIIEQFNCEI